MMFHAPPLPSWCLKGSELNLTSCCFVTRYSRTSEQSAVEPTGLGQIAVFPYASKAELEHDEGLREETAHEGNMFCSAP